MSPIENRKSKIENFSYHLVGIAGVGMSALAQVLLAQGCRVSGSDRYLDAGRALDHADSVVNVLEKLRSAGVQLRSQDGNGVTADLTGLVISSAIEADNPDIAAARRLRVPILHRAECLAQWANAKTCQIAITGTAGKTTVTGIIGWALAQLGADPTVVNGGALLNWVDPRQIGNVRVGRSDVWVVEVDESDRSLLRFHPDWAVITNMSKDHFELSEVRHLFKAFAGQVKCGVVGCYGTAAADEPLNGFKPDLSAEGIHFGYRGVDFNLPLLGRHNAENALQAVMLCERLGYALPLISRALAGFGGIQRRLERLGMGRGVTVIDDYAHNPAKIGAAWDAVAPYYRRVLAVWRPHGFAPLALMLGELVQAFCARAKSADRVFILPVYFAGGTAQRTVTADTLVNALRERGVCAELAANYDDLLARLKAAAQAGDGVLWMGARDPDIGIYARRFVAELL
ncbi:MAG: UDP-N-acetylmuramate--alanine ligase [Verrucomicrobia bacterium]|nr:UDP-N-acetylmuramate--alanine ligase [Verrucomicrobiota bacterium]MBU1735116.1 UDP-N-acetylmuramate--alanine ligase [Verrucomicrobiota bacterium]MBU1856368.1 UDP-N-acetylmuramate--alanine ligase [Verrucomicrobiota bacterium]